MGVIIPFPGMRVIEACGRCLNCGDFVHEQDGEPFYAHISNMLCEEIRPFVEVYGVQPFETEVVGEIRRPTHNEIMRWIALAEKKEDELVAAGLVIDSTLPYGHDDCHADGSSEDGDCHESVADAVETGVANILWGGFSGSELNRWVEVVKLIAFDDRDEEPAPRHVLLTLKLDGDHIIAVEDDGTKVVCLCGPDGGRGYGPNPECPIDGDLDH